MKDCNCLTHDGPHDEHMEAFEKRENHELLLQLQDYHEACKVDNNADALTLYAHMFDATLDAYAQAELARLDEKKQRLLAQEARCKLEQEEQARLAEKAQQIERESRENAITTTVTSSSRSK